MTITITATRLDVNVVFVTMGPYFSETMSLTDYHKLVERLSKSCILKITEQNFDKFNPPALHENN